MKAFSSFDTLIAAQRSVRENYRMLTSCVMPRPIALVSTLSSGGVPNLAPFSFFNAVGANPPTVMFCPSRKRDDSDKDTMRNVRDVGEFVVNVVPHTIREPMNESAFPFGPDVNEFETSGFSTLPSRYVKPDRVAESPVHMECKLVRVVPIGDGPLSSSICIGEVLCFHVASDHWLDDTMVDRDRLDLIGRLGGDGYTTTRDHFDLARPAGKG